MIKSYVLDTNILLLDSDCIFKFADNEVVIPLPVLDELDGLKNSRDTETAYQARRANRSLKNLLQNDIRTTIEGGVIRFCGEYDKADIPPFLDPNKPDHLILAICKALSRRENIQTILVSEDASMCAKAKEVFGLTVEEYKNQQINTAYTGRATLSVPDEVIGLDWNQTVSTKTSSFCCDLKSMKATQHWPVIQRGKSRY